MSLPMSLRLVRGHAHQFFASLVLTAFLCALASASSPWLHERLHQMSAHHECAATILAAGNCDQTVAPQQAPKISDAPTAAAFVPLAWPCLIAAMPSSILEHAPPRGE